MDRKELARQQKQMVDAERARFLAMNPDVATWIQIKKTIRNAVLIYCVLHSVFTVILMLSMEPHGNIAMEVARLLFQMLWVCVFINPEGNWQLSLILYLWALSNFGMLLQYAKDIMDTVAYIFYQPVYGVVVVLEVMAPFLFLAVAVFLTAFPRNRQLSERASAFQKQLAEMVKQMAR